jgi:hypothetical protein
MMRLSKIWEEIERQARNAVSSEVHAFTPKADISIQELAYVVQHRLMDRYFTDEEWAAYPEVIRRHFDGPIEEFE